MLKKHQMPTSDSNSSRSEHVYFSPHFYTCQRLCVESLNGFINMASKAICFTVSCTVCPWLSISSLTSFRVPFIYKMVMQNRYENILPHGCVSASFSTLSERSNAWSFRPLYGKGHRVWSFIHSSQVPITFLEVRSSPSIWKAVKLVCRKQFAFLQPFYPTMTCSIGITVI